MYLKENHGALRDRKKLTIRKAKSNSIPTSRDVSGVLKDGSFGVNHDYLLRTEVPESTLGWPLLRRSAREEYLRKSEAREMSVVQWAMSLPNRFQVDTCPDQGTDISTVDSEAERDSLRLIQSSEDTNSHSDDNSDLVSEQQVKMGNTSVSSCLNESTLSSPGWPLLHIAVASLDSLRESEAINMSSMFQLNTPKQIKASPLTQFNMVSNKMRNPSRRNILHPGIMNNENCLVPPEILANELELPVITNSSSCTRFSYAELKIATNQFSHGKKNKAQVSHCQTLVSLFYFILVNILVSLWHI